MMFAFVEPVLQELPPPEYWPSKAKKWLYWKGEDWNTPTFHRIYITAIALEFSIGILLDQPD
jgi:hypothetical protein